MVICASRDLVQGLRCPEIRRSVVARRKVMLEPNGPQRVVIALESLGVDRMGLSREHHPIGRSLVSGYEEPQAHSSGAGEKLNDVHPVERSEDATSVSRFQ
jgi:hypothetical protein